MSKSKSSSIKTTRKRISQAKVAGPSKRKGVRVPLSVQPKSSGTRVQSCDFCRKKREAYTPTDDPTQCLYCWYDSLKTGVDRRCTFSGSLVPGKRNDLHKPAAKSSGKEHDVSRAQKKKAPVQKKSPAFKTTKVSLNCCHRAFSPVGFFWSQNCQTQKSLSSSMDATPTRHPPTGTKKATTCLS